MKRDKTEDMKWKQLQYELNREMRNLMLKKKGKSNDGK